MKRISTLALVATTSLLLAHPATAGDLKAGAAKVKITPELADFPMKASGEKDFVSVHDDTYARAIALDDGHDRFIMVNLEVTIVPYGEDMIKAVASATNLPPSHVLVFSTHTHSSPLVFYHGHDATPAQQRAIDKTRAGAISAANAAVAALQPARIGYVRGKAYANINNGEGAGLKRWFDPQGRSSKDLNVLDLETRDGKPLALLVNYASHGEVMFRSVSKDGGYEASGDLPGATMRLLEGGGVSPVVLWSPAAEADQLPLFKSVQPAAPPFPATDEGAQGWALVDVLSRRLAIEVVDALAQVGPTRSDASIDVKTATVSCPSQKLLVDHDNGKASDAAPVEIPVSYMRINDIALAGVAGDVDSKIGEGIQSAVSHDKSMVMTLMAGSVGYVLSDEAYLTPGHGVGSSSLKAGCAETSLVNKFKTLDALK